MVVISHSLFQRNYYSEKEPYLLLLLLLPENVSP